MKCGARRSRVQEIELELAVGDVLQVGERTLTLIDINGPEVTFRIDSADFIPEESGPVFLPRK